MLRCMSRHLRLAWLSSGAVLACQAPAEPDDEADPPPLIWDGERVVFGDPIRDGSVGVCRKIGFF